jgi:hypothetical protein
MISCKSKIVRDNGLLKIEINGEKYLPLSFKSFRPNPQNISEFYQAGVRLFSVLSSGVTSALGVPYSLYGESWIGNRKYDFSAIDRQMDMFIANAPEAYFGVMLQLDTRDWFLKENPETPNSFTNLSQVACDEKWRTLAADYLKNAIKHIEEKYGDKVYGYFLLCGTTTEWFSDLDYEKPHVIKNKGFKNWLGDENANLPSQDRMNETGRVFLNQEENDVFLARKFHNGIIADLILYFVSQAQSVIQHNKLLGLYYGYLFELGAPRLYNAGSLGYEKVYLSPDIDVISSPSSYGYRGIDDPSAFMVTQKSLDIHNKVYFLEFDHITHVAPSKITDGLDKNAANGRLLYIPGAENKCKDLNETMNLMYRDYVLCQANGAALWWFDMFDGWFRSDEMMSSIAKIIRIANEISQYKQESKAEIAVFAEGEAMLRTRKTEDLATICLSDIRRTLAECGAPYDLYSISDFSKDIIDKYKFFVFVNQYDISDAVKKHIENRCKQNNKTILWLYAPDYAKEGTCNVENICNVTGINVVESDTSHGGIVYNDIVANFTLSAPYFSINDSDSDSIAYFEDGTVAIAKKKYSQYSSIYSSVCNLPSQLLRELLKGSGIYIYSNESKVYTYINSLVVGVYNATEEDAIINLPDDGVYNDYISGENFICKDGKIILPKKEINAYLLRRIEG